MASEKKDKLDAQVRSADMSQEMQDQAIEVAHDAMDKFTIEKDIAQYIKKEVCASLQTS
ncbi:Dynein light chain [Lecanora helva]